MICIALKAYPEQTGFIPNRYMIQAFARGILDYCVRFYEI